MDGRNIGAVLISAMSLMLNTYTQFLKNAHDSIVMGISHVAFSSISLGVNSGGKTAPSFQSMGVKRG